MSKIRFSVLSYHPSFMTSESINIGILFEYKNVLYFEHIKDFKRLQAFDDELNIDFAKLFLTGIKQEVETEPSLFDTTIYTIDSYVKDFINEFKFCNINNFDCFDIKKTIEEIKKIYLRFEYTKDKRPGKNEQIDFFKRFLEHNGKIYSKNPIEGTHGEKNNYDFVIDHYGIKFFKIKNKNVNRMVSTAKSWAFTADEMHSKDIKTIFIYDDVDKHEIATNTLISILKKNASVLTLDESLKFINEL